jgi:PhzF family phenazine biosynthesis protein
MPDIRMYQVDAFTGKLFGGNPAAVCPLHDWLPDALMQSIAAENNLAETAFFVAEGKGYRIRWFTPKAEVDLCGHATLASAHVLFTYLGVESDEVIFASRSGELKVRRKNDALTLDFPADEAVRVNAPDFLLAAFSEKPLEVLKGAMDYLLVFETQAQVERMQPKMELIAKAESRGAIITAKGERSDFVSRYFAPQFGIPEDPVTGSAHTVLTPYWAKKLGKNELDAIQLSERKGHLQCLYKGARVEITGHAVTFLIGKILVPGPDVA